MKLFLDSKTVEFNSNSTILFFCDLLKKSIPRFCYHQKLSIAGNCRMCLVQVEESLKPIASCAAFTSANLRIFTNSFLIKKARESVIEFLLINHPLDCPICDQGGECDLQDQTIVYGGDRGRFFEQKRAVKNIEFNNIIKTFMTRCIHCTRCIRFSSEILGLNNLGLVGRGNNVRISTFIEKAMYSELSGNLADICPVGALTIKPYAFVARPWELKSFNTLDIFDSHSNGFKLDVRGHDILRVTPLIISSTNQEWISDVSRFFFDSLKIQRLTMPGVFDQIHANFQKLSWSQTFFLMKSILTKFSLDNLLLKKNIDFNFGKLTEIDIFEVFKTIFLFANIQKTIFNFNFLSKKKLITFRLSYCNSWHLVQNTNNLFLLGVNLKTEAPLQNVEIIKVLFKSRNFGLVGLVKSQINFEFLTMFCNLRMLSLFFKSRSNFSRFLKFNKFNCINVFIGSAIFAREDAAKIIFFDQILKKNSNISTCVNSVLADNAQLNAFEVGII